MRELIIQIPAAGTMVIRYASDQVILKRSAGGHAYQTQHIKALQGLYGTGLTLMALTILA